MVHLLHLFFLILKGGAWATVEEWSKEVIMFPDQIYNLKQKL
jgi:hypothetical protein